MSNSTKAIAGVVKAAVIKEYQDGLPWTVTKSCDSYEEAVEAKKFWRSQGYREPGCGFKRQVKVHKRGRWPLEKWIVKTRVLKRAEKGD